MPKSPKLPSEVSSDARAGHFLRPGLIVAACSAAVPMPYAAAAFIQSFREGRKIGLRSPKVPVALCLSGHSRFQETVKQTLHQCRHSEDAAAMRLYSTGVGQTFEWTRPEALRHVIAAMELKQGAPEFNDSATLAMIAHQRVSEDQKFPDLKEGLLRIDETAKKSSMLFLLLLQTERPEAVVSIADAAVDVALISKCEPDPGALDAFAVKWLGMETLEPSGWGHSLVQVKYDGNDLAVVVRPFSGANFLDRLIHAGLGPTRSQADIARELGITRTTVSRHLSALRTCYRTTGANEWYAKYLELYKSALDSKSDDQ